MEECNSNAIQINASSGEIFVRDEHLFDREMVESILCKVRSINYQNAVDFLDKTCIFVAPCSFVAEEAISIDT